MSSGYLDAKHGGGPVAAPASASAAAGRHGMPGLADVLPSAAIRPMKGPAPDAPLPLVATAPRTRISRRLFGGIVVLGDAVVLAVAFPLVFLASHGMAMATLAGIVAYFVLSWLSAQYDGRKTQGAMIPAVLAWVVAACGAGALLAVSEGTAPDWNGFALWASVSMVLLLGWRMVLGQRAEAWRRRGDLVMRLAVIGTAGAEALQSGVGRHGPSMGVALAGRHDAGDPAVPAGMLRWPALWSEVTAGQVDGVIVALPWADPGVVMEACRAVRALAVDVWLLPPAGSTAALMSGEDILPGVTLLAVDRRPLADWRGVAKRTEDLVLGSLLTLAFAVPMLVVAALVRMDSRGPVLLRQRRFGYGNAPFFVFKFRTMYHDMRDISGARATVPGDRRVTRLGRWLRASSLDELPQLFNVLRGEMSLVGPRPHPVEMLVQGRHYHLVVPDYAARHRMKPGITGLAQISGFRGLVDTEDKAHGRVAHDLSYIRTWSVRQDLVILWQTGYRGFFGSGAF